MPSVSIRVSGRGRETLGELALKEGRPMGAVLEEAIEEYRRTKFLEAANASYAALKSDPKAWRQELEERELWDNAGADGLEGE
ncbi:MAG: toxin-antitoxin system protein [Bryobacteraceae bacterium]|jgi:predicted transcriptional regulator